MATYKYPTGAVDIVTYVEVDEAFVADGADTAVEATLTQPANTIINSIQILVLTAPVVVADANADLGFKAGTTTSTAYGSGATEFVNTPNGMVDAAGATDALDAGAAYTVYDFASSTADADVPVNDAYTDTDRTLFLNTLCTNEADPDAGEGGKVLWICRFTPVSPK